MKVRAGGGEAGSVRPGTAWPCPSQGQSVVSWDTTLSGHTPGLSFEGTQPFISNVLFEFKGVTVAL